MAFAHMDVQAKGQHLLGVPLAQPHAQTGWMGEGESKVGSHTSHIKALGAVSTQAPLGRCRALTTSAWSSKQPSKSRQRIYMRGGLTYLPHSDLAPCSAF